MEEHPSLQVLSIDMAKGLEFDNVIFITQMLIVIPTINEIKNPVYCYFRGMKRVVLPYTGTLSEWFTPYLAAQ